MLACHGWWISWEYILDRRIASEVAKLAAQVTSLARLLLGRVTNGDFAALVGVNVCTSASAVAISWDRLLVEVVHWERFVREQS